MMKLLKRLKEENSCRLVYYLKRALGGRSILGNPKSPCSKKFKFESKIQREF